MNDLVRRCDALRMSTEPGFDYSQCAEWLVTNGLGGYASGTVAGPVTRRYHGLLISAMPAPLGRMLMLNGIIEELHFADGRVADFSPAREPDEHHDAERLRLVEFRLVSGLPVWRYETEGAVLEKRLHLPYRQNTVHIGYRLLSCDERIDLKLRPLIHFRQHEQPVATPPEEPYLLTVFEDQYEVSSGKLPPLRMILHGNGDFLVERKKFERVLYQLEEQRGYESVGDLWSPGSFHVSCEEGDRVTLIASAESWEVVRALDPIEAWDAELERRERLVVTAHPKAREGFGAELVLAADQFIAAPAGRLLATTHAHAHGDDVRTIIAGYHWFTDWGRDTMISLEGLTLTTNRFQEAAWILRNFANSIRDGLIPNFFPEHNHEGVYHTADATLWFFHALDRYVNATADRRTLREVLPRLVDVVERHLRGTRYGIGVDTQDGLLRQGQTGYQLTWMDAKVGDWVVTPRRGKAVEINALWYNALRLLERWLDEEGDSAQAREVAAHASRVRAAFNERFWFSGGGYLYDVVDGEGGDDPAFRPNQLLAVSLPYPVLDDSRWREVVDKVRQRLLTPVGLRSLERDHPDYKAKYFGDLRARDAAYHQGTVWGWLIGPMIDAWLKVYPDDVPGAHALLQGFIPNVSEACIGSISEIFDGEPPYTPRGCVSQAWSVAEVLRCWVRTAP